MTAQATWTNDDPAARVEGAEASEERHLRLSGVLDASSTARIWRETDELLDGSGPEALVVDASELSYCDGAGMALLMHLRDRQVEHHRSFDLVGLSNENARLFELYETGEKHPPAPPTANLGGVEQIGKAFHLFLRDLVEMTRFVGELATALASAVRDPGRVRWRDTARIAEATGAGAVPIVALIVFLVGLILAYQGSIALQKFGAQVFVADLVALSLVREIGPLMTAIVLTGRTGSAFAAEIGTMKVREEIDALVTMGLSPTRFLVVPRVIAAVVTTPLLVVFANLCGLLGGAVVYLLSGFSLVSFVSQVSRTLDLGDLLGGLFKAFCFGIVVAAVGSVRGLQTTSGASAVGVSTTRAVVTGITLIVVGDGIFSVAYFYLGI